MMISYFSKIISLKNLRINKPQAQIATLLMLIMVAMLFFVLSTVNMGQVSITVTNLANAADSASLNLGSQLSTKSRMLWESLGRRTQRCYPCGILGTVLAIVFAVVAIVLAPWTGGASLQAFFASCAAGGWATIGIAAAGGALGGAIGGGITGTGALNGAVQGAMVGAAIGGAMSTMGSIMGTGTTPGSVTTSSGFAGPEGATDTAYHFYEPGEFVPKGTELFDGSVIAGSASNTLTVANLTASAGIYNAYVSDQMVQAAFASAAKALSGLPENERIREGVFLQALSQTIDDPNTIQDFDDSDGDGDTKEKIPYFQFWWDRRIEDLRNSLGGLNGFVDGFVNGSLTEFATFLQNQYSPGGPFSRQVRDENGQIISNDGIIVELGRALENTNYNLSFFKPGYPLDLGLDNPNCRGDDCDNVLDEIESLRKDLYLFTETVKELKRQSIEQLVLNWDSWAKLFYDPESDDSYYSSLQQLINGADEEFKGLASWKSEMKTKRLLLPECVYGPCAQGGGSGEVCNPPCKLESSINNLNAATINENPDDEFTPALAAVDEIINRIEAFRAACKDFYVSMQMIAESATTGYGGVNPVTYNWTDSRGQHSIKVQVGPFKTARIVKTKKGNSLKCKICLTLVDYQDNGSHAWVEITRQDPVNQNVGIIGRWNPFITGRIIRKSRASYSFDRVGIAGIK